MEKKKYWFVQKRFGYGLVPVSWQGWLLTLALIVAIFGAVYAAGIPENGEDPEMELIIRYLLDVLILTTIFILIAKEKSKGALKWRWGADEDTY